MKLRETLQEGAERESREETALLIRATEAVYTFDFIHRDDQGQIRFHYVIIDLLADLIGGNSMLLTMPSMPDGSVPKKLKRLK